MPAGVRERLRSALRVAMTTRDAAAVSAIRTALAAVDNAEAVEPPPSPASSENRHVAGSTAGLGAAEAARRDLGEPEVRALVRAEADELAAGAAEYDRLGASAEADRLRRGVDVLLSLLGDEPES